MDRKSKIGVAIGTVVIGIGAALGIAEAASSSSSAAAPAQGGNGYGPPQSRQGQPPGDGTGMHGGGDQIAAGLAAKLDVDQSVVQGVLDQVFAANRTSGHNDRQGLSSMDGAIAKALAARTSISEDTILAALQSLRPGGAPGGGPATSTASPTPSATA